MIHEARNGVCGDAALGWVGPQGMHIHSLPSPRLVLEWQPQDRYLLGWSTLACLPEKQSRQGKPSLAEFCDVYRLWWILVVPGTAQTCRTAQCRCTNIVTTTKEISTSIRSLSGWGESSCTHTKPAAVFFKWTAREPGIRRTKLSHSPWSMFIKNIFTSLVWSVYFREWKDPDCPVEKDEGELKKDASCSQAVPVKLKLSYLGLK